LGGRGGGGRGASRSDSKWSNTSTLAAGFAVVGTGTASETAAFRNEKPALSDVGGTGVEDPMVSPSNNPVEVSSVGTAAEGDLYVVEASLESKS